MEREIEVWNALVKLSNEAQKSWVTEDEFRLGYEQALRDVQSLLDEELGEPVQLEFDFEKDVNQ